MAKKKYDNGLLKTELSEDRKTINFSISVSKLKWLFKNSPTNPTENTIKSAKTQDFVDHVLTHLSEPSIYDDNTVKWLAPFEEIFGDINSGDEDFVNYRDFD